MFIYSKKYFLAIIFALGTAIAIRVRNQDVPHYNTAVFAGSVAASRPT
jgi:hypothetical protein